MNARERVRVWWARVQEFVFRNRVNTEMDEEIRFHLEEEIAFNVQRGMSPDAARRTALQAFGGVQRYREETRDARGIDRSRRVHR